MSSGAMRLSSWPRSFTVLAIRTERDQRVALEIQLGDQPLAKAVAEDRHVDMHRPPVIAAIRPGIGARADGQELVVAVFIRQRTAAAAEIGVERRQIAVLLVAVAPAGIGLPYLDQGVRHGTRILIQAHGRERECARRSPALRLWSS